MIVIIWNHLQILDRAPAIAEIAGNRSDLSQFAHKLSLSQTFLVKIEQQHKRFIDLPVTWPPLLGAKLQNVLNYILIFLLLISQHIFAQFNLIERFVPKLKFENIKFDFCLFVCLFKNRKTQPVFCSEIMAGFEQCIQTKIILTSFPKIEKDELNLDI